MSESFDVVVIGGGPAGEVAAGCCAKGGLSVALVEKERVGGECSFWACMPSKALLRPGEVLAAAQRVPGARRAISGTLETSAALGWRDAIVDHLDDARQARWLEDQKISLLRGIGRLTGPRAVDVAGSDGNVRHLAARRAVILATGSVPSVPPVAGLRESRPWSSRDATSARAAPRRLVVLGGGAVGLELAQAFRRLGLAEVTVLEAAPRLLPNEEPFAGESVAAAFEREGIAVRVGCRVTEVRRGAGATPVRVQLEHGTAVEADEVLVAAGRRPASGELGLETVGLTPGHAVEVDEHLRAKGVSDEWLYAVGDVNGRAALTHMGKYQGRVAAAHVLGRGNASALALTMAAVPRVTFTDPQVAAVGLTRAAAEQRGLTARVVQVPLESTAAATVRGEGVAGVGCLVLDARRQVCVGATFLGPEIGELLHSATVAIVGEVPVSRLAHAVPSFPTLSEVWLHLLEALER
ncbi:MAG: NAD(P)/FAD-dependent oxidoreductase [Myxococcales bacterium]